MNADLAMAIVSASATALVAIVAILTNSKGLDDTNGRMGRLETRMDRFESKLIRSNQGSIGPATRLTSPSLKRNWE